MYPEAVIASLVAKAMTTEFISQELENPPPSPPPPPPPPPPRIHSGPIPSIVMVPSFDHSNQELSMDHMDRTHENASTIDIPPPPAPPLGISPYNNRKISQRSSPAFPKRKNDLRMHASKSSSRNQSSKSPGSRKSQPETILPSSCEDRTDELHRAESFHSLEDMALFCTNFVATSSPVSVAVSNQNCHISPRSNSSSLYKKAF